MIAPAKRPRRATADVAELERIKLQRMERCYVPLAQSALKYLAVLGGIWLIFRGLAPMFSNSPEQIGAMAKFVTALRPGSMLGYIWGGLMTGGFMLERRGKRRAIKEKNKYQNIVEKNDFQRTSSGLNEDGSTPQEA